ncbi:MAG: hypothetical protein K8T25_17480 [Planctomycetia bacterium]|nr:hypothetical protein [Planctomycetia bacterium]
MKTLPKSKSRILCLSLLFAAVLAGLTALTSLVAPQHPYLGLAARIAAAAVVIPCVLLGFNALCDRLDGLKSTEELPSGTGMQSVEKRSESPRSNSRSSRRKIKGIGILVESNETATPFASRISSSTMPGTVCYSIRLEKRRPAGMKWWGGQ